MHLIFTLLVLSFLSSFYVLHVNSQSADGWLVFSHSIVLLFIQHISLDQDLTVSRWRLVEPRSSGSIYKELPPLRLREHCRGEGWKDCKKQRIRDFALRLSRQVASEATALTSHQQECPNMSWDGDTTEHMKVDQKKPTSSQLFIKTSRQLKCYETRIDGCLQRTATGCLVSNIHISNIIKAGYNKKYIFNI